MFSTLAILSTITLALSVAAAPSGQAKCNTGEIQCCNKVHQSNSASAADLKAIVGGSAQGLTGMVGQNCSPLTAVGISNGATCTQQPVCCENNQMNGLIVVGCTPINISL